MPKMVGKPIIFSAPMILALLDGRKTQTRRILRPQPACYQNPPGFSWGRFSGLYPDDWFGYGNEIDAALPYSAGDRLWVREAWSEEHPIAVQPGRYSQPGRAGIPGPPSVHYRVVYRADGEPLQVWRRDEFPYFGLGGPRDDLDAAYPTVVSNFTRGRGIHWSPPIHMPRWASRLTLTVTDVRVQRLQEISREDAVAEGCARPDLPPEFRPGPSDYVADERTTFAIAWNRIHGRRAWNANPWVVALTFTVQYGNIDEVAQ